MIEGVEAREGQFDDIGGEKRNIYIYKWAIRGNNWNPNQLNVTGKASARERAESGERERETLSLVYPVSLALYTKLCTAAGFLPRLETGGGDLLLYIPETYINSARRLFYFPQRIIGYSHSGTLAGPLELPTTLPISLYISPVRALFLYILLLVATTNLQSVATT